MTFDEVIAFARGEHARYLKDLIANIEARQEDPDPLPHFFLFDRDSKLSVFALAMSSDPNLQEFLRKFRLTLQAQITLEGSFASVYCGIVLLARAPNADIQRAIREKARTDPHFLQTLEQEIGLQNRPAVVAVAESAGRQFVLEQIYYLRDGKVILDEEPVETLDKGVPRLPYTSFRWG